MPRIVFEGRGRAGLGGGSRVGIRSGGGTGVHGVFRRDAMVRGRQFARRLTAWPWGERSCVAYEWRERRRGSVVAIDAAVRVSAHGRVPGGVVGGGIWVSGVTRAVLGIGSGLYGLAEGAP